jgi:uncharacterized membrane protein
VSLAKLYWRGAFAMSVFVIAAAVRLVPVAFTGEHRIDFTVFVGIMLALGIAVAVRALRELTRH